MGLIDNISAELARLRRENDALRTDLAREASLLVQRNASVALDNARAEIEKLRADLASIRSVYDFAALEAKIAELRAENDMMRSLIIDAPTKEERDAIFNRRFAIEQKAPRKQEDYNAST